MTVTRLTPLLNEYMGEGSYKVNFSYECILVYNETIYNTWGQQKCIEIQYVMGMAFDD